MKNFNNVLFLEKRGCDFVNGDRVNDLSDVTNYRVGIYRDRIHAKNGKNYILEFTRYDRRKTRYTNKRTGAPLKHPVIYIDLENALHIDTEFENDRGAWRDCNLEEELHARNYTFNKADILTAVNDISVKQYTEIILLPAEEIKDILSHLYKIGGYRERNVIDDLAEVKTVQYDKDYHVYKFISKSGAAFEYERLSDRITG
jgi:hypothetical protein